MPSGISRNSPVKLSFTKDNYVALIERHGQWTRWRTATKCSCVKLPSMQPDIHCRICGGRGFTYSYQRDQVSFDIVMEKGNSGILEVNERFTDGELVEVYNYEGERFPNAEKIGKYVYLHSDKPLNKGVYYNIILRIENLKKLDFVYADKMNDFGYYSLSELKVGKPSVEGVYYGAAGDIVKIGKITDANGLEYEPKDFRLNQFRIEPKTEIVIDEETGEETEVEIPITEPVMVEDVEYIPPFIFAILNQNLSKADLQAVTDYQGDAICSFPYELDVASDDVLTVLAGSYTNKEVICRSNYPSDTLGVYFVYDVVNCTMIRDNEVIEFKQGIDFIITENNKIR